MIGDQLAIPGTHDLEVARPDRLELLIVAWLASYASEHTRRAYGRDARLWVAWCRHTADVDPLAARRVHADAWARAGAGFTKKPKPASLARRLSAVSAWYAYLVEEEVTDRNPFGSVRRPSVDRDHSGTRGLTVDEARVFLTFAREAIAPRDGIAMRLMLLSGLREGSVIAADVEGLHIDRGHRVLTTTVKGDREHTTVLTPDLAHSIDEWVERQGLTEGPLLPTSTGARLSPSHLFRAVQRCAALAGIEDPDSVTPHSLRHTYATLALDAGAQLHEVQDSMGHADPRTTRRYDRARNRLSKHPAYKLAAELDH